jgi:N-acetylglutamate synthase-like GNAT family acetyltransferase
VVGYGGLELFGGDALLRSVVVKPAYRRAGHGRAIVEDLIARATRIGAQEIWLLTSTAPAFFTVMGFSCTPRDAASPAIAASREFSSLCPSSAVLMRWRVGPANEA